MNIFDIDFSLLVNRMNISVENDTFNRFINWPFNQFIIFYNSIRGMCNLFPFDCEHKRRPIFQFSSSRLTNANEAQCNKPIAMWKILINI